MERPVIISRPVESRLTTQDRQLASTEAMEGLDQPHYGGCRNLSPFVVEHVGLVDALYASEVADVIDVEEDVLETREVGSEVGVNRELERSACVKDRHFAHPRRIALFPATHSTIPVCARTGFTAENPRDRSCPLYRTPGMLVTVFSIRPSEMIAG